MKVIRLMGGLGNQLFQYAFALQLRDNGEDVIFDISGYKTDYRTYQLSFVKSEIKCVEDPFFSDQTIMGKIRRKINIIFGRYVKENESIDYDEKLFGKKVKYLSGYFQSEKYFFNVASEIKKIKFSGGEPRLTELGNRIKKIKNSVSIHFRRGDYLSFSEEYGNICTENYYMKAAGIIKNLFQDVTFIIFSDDINWAKSFFDNKAIYIEKGMFEFYHDWYDLKLMSICQHNIIANSSFSWWAAWLNQYEDKVVICPKRWNNKYNRQMKCEGWIEV